MNPKTKRILGVLLKLALVILVFTFILKNEMENYYHQVLYAAMVYMPVYLLLFGAFVVFVFFEIYLFSKTKQKYVLLPTLVGLILIFSSVYINRLHFSKLNRKTCYKASISMESENGETTKYIIEFKDNSEYVVYEILYEGTYTNFYFGSYVKTENRIVLGDKIGGSGISQHLKLIDLTNDTYHPKLALVQIDSNGDEIKGRKQLKVNIKN